ncbi:MAG TPA: hypothetical protein VEX86_15065 [Longimicrobium sp.]|nr:hypothetical protein [Longimicrobium sp.]
MFKTPRSPRAFVLLAIFAILLIACDSPSGPGDEPLTDEEILNVTPPDLDMLVQAYETVRSDHPRVSEDSNEFSRLLLKEVEKRTTSGTGNRVAATGRAVLPRLTSAEWKVIMSRKNWQKAGPMKTIKEEAEGRAAAEFPANTLLDGTGDAFRHAYWNVLMAKTFSVEWAREWATAHESETPEGNQKNMELNNNEVGRNLVSNNPTLDAAALAEKIKAYPVACVSSSATINTAQLIYIRDCPTIRVFDDGPEYDDIFEVTLGATVLGVTPAGGGTTFQTNGLVSGTYPLRVRCTLDGTQGGCGFEVRLARGLTFPGGSTGTAQLSMNQGGTVTLSVVAPTLGGTLQTEFRSMLNAPRRRSSGLRL